MAGEARYAEDRLRPFRFTIRVWRAGSGEWKANVDTDDAQDRTFTGTSAVAARIKAERFCQEWALGQADSNVEGYEYDYSPPIIEGSHR